MKAKHKVGTSLEEIVTDGWSRGFQDTQIVDEAHAMGYMISEEEVHNWCNALEFDLKAFYEKKLK